MILKEITLENIRSYTNQTIKFSKGSTILAGDIGAGKTTILLAIEFAIFGLLRGITTGQNLLRNTSNEGSVTLTLILNNQKITIHRKLKKTKDTITQTNGYLIINNQKTEYTPQELKARMLEILGYPKQFLNKSKNLIYRYTVFTPQEEMKSILFEDKEARIQTLKKIFNIDKYNTIKENTKTIKRELKQKTSKYEGLIEGLTELKTEQERLLQDLERLNKDYEKLKIEESKEKKELEEQKKELEKIEIKKKEKEKLELNLKLTDNKIENTIIQKTNLEKEKTEINNKIKELYSKSDTKKDLVKVKEELESINQKITKKEKELETQTDFLNRTKNLISNFETKINQDSRQKNQTKKRIELLNKEIQKDKEKIKQTKEEEKIKTEIQELETNKKNLETKLDKEKELLYLFKSKLSNSEKIKKQVLELDNCPLCKQEVTKNHKESISSQEDYKLKNYSKEIETLTQKIKETQTLQSKTEKELKKLISQKELIEINKIFKKNIEKNTLTLTELEKEIEELLEKEKESTKKTEKLKESLTLGENKLKELQTENKTLKEKKEIFQKQNQDLLIIEEKEKRNHTISLELNKLTKQEKEYITQKETTLKNLEDYKDIEKIYTEQYKLIIENEKIYNELKINLTKTEKDLDYTTKESDKILKTIKKKEEFKQKHTRLSNFTSWLDNEFLNLINQIEKQAMLTIYMKFNSHFCKWFKILLEDDLLNVRLDEDYTPLIIQNGYETNISSLSGGEKTSCALAYRLALNIVINESIQTINTKDLIILDEPTDGFSSEQLDKLRDVLNLLDLSQVIIVSHEQKIESYVQNIIRVEKENHITKIF
jgi:DNA repair protein SbcC/Rad50